MSRRAGDRRVLAVGGDEVDDRLAVPDANAKSIQLAYGTSAASPVWRRTAARAALSGGDAVVAAARDVDHGQVERQADQVVAQRLGDELVDLVAAWLRHAPEDGAGGRLRRGRQSRRRREGQRVEEAVEQRMSSVACRRSVDAVDRLGQHRVAEAVDRVGELGEDRRVDVGEEADAVTGTG